MTISAHCSKCGLTFPSAWGSALDGTRQSMVSNCAETCPRCGATVDSPEISTDHEGKVHVRQLVGHLRQRSVEDLHAVHAMLQQVRHEGKSAEVPKRLEEVDSELAQVAAWLLTSLRIEPSKL